MVNRFIEEMNTYAEDQLQKFRSGQRTIGVGGISSFARRSLAQQGLAQAGTSKVRELLFRGALGAAGVVGGAIATAGVLFTPQPQYQDRTIIEHGSYLYGKGLLEGETEAYLLSAIQNSQAIEDARAKAAAEARLKYGGVYLQEEINKIWAQQQARYYSNQAYPTFNTPGATQKTSNMIMPYKVHIK